MSMLFTEKQYRGFIMHRYRLWNESQCHKQARLMRVCFRRKLKNGIEIFLSTHGVLSWHIELTLKSWAFVILCKSCGASNCPGNSGSSLARNPGKFVKLTSFFFFSCSCPATATCLAPPAGLSTGCSCSGISVINSSTIKNWWFFSQRNIAAEVDAGYECLSFFFGILNLFVRFPKDAHTQLQEKTMSKID